MLLLLHSTNWLLLGLLASLVHEYRTGSAPSFTPVSGTPHIAHRAYRTHPIPSANYTKLATKTQCPLRPTAELPESEINQRSKNYYDCPGPFYPADHVECCSNNRCCNQLSAILGSSNAYEFFFG